jgi:hypothetical protein
LWKGLSAASIRLRFAEKDSNGCLYSPEDLQAMEKKVSRSVRPCSKKLFELIVRRKNG